MIRRKIIIAYTLVGMLSISASGTMLLTSRYRANLEKRELELAKLLEEHSNLKDNYYLLKEDILSLKNELSEVQGKYETTTKEKEELQETINEMNSKVSFNQGDVRITSGATEYHLKKALGGTELYSLIGTFLQAEEEYNINVYFLISIVALESGWGKSERANNGSNNLTGFAVYHDSSPGVYFSSKEECILETAKLLSTDYLDPNGKYFGGGYTPYDINKKYSADDNWCYKVEDITYTLLELSNK